MVVGVPCDGVDLSYSFNDTTIFWPGGEKFKLCMECSISPEFGFHYAAGTFSCAEHGGTHVDAPFHFSKDGKTVDLISIADLIAPCRVIDISNQCTEHGPDYSLTTTDIEHYEHLHGLIEAGNIVLVRTGWSKKWREGPTAYLGYDEATDGPYNSETSQLSFPGIEADAARLLVTRKVAAVGLDTGKNVSLRCVASRFAERIFTSSDLRSVHAVASLDPGKSRDFAAHCILLGAGIYGIENLNENIDRLPVAGFTLIVMPMKIGGGSGAPARVVATIPSARQPESVA